MKLLLAISAIAIYTSILIAIDNTQNQTDLNLTERIKCLEWGLVSVGDGFCVDRKDLFTTVTTVATTTYR